MTYRADGARIIGNVVFGKDCSVWYNAVLRGDSGAITFGDRVNIQDNVTVHSGRGYDVSIGNDVTIGHNAVIHGCTVGSHVLIGMGAILMNGCSIGSCSIVAAGAVVTENRKFEDGVLIMGIPGRAVRKLREEEIREIGQNADDYVHLAEKELASEK